MTDTRAILEERGAVYGDFLAQAQITGDLKMVMHARLGWAKLSPDMEEALDMIAVKIARILNGNPRHTDSWDDIAGYATLVADRLGRS